MDVPLKFAYELSLAFVEERVPVPGAQMSGLIRLLPSAVTGPRLLNPAIVSVPVLESSGGVCCFVKSGWILHS